VTGSTLLLTFGLWIVPLKYEMFNDDTLFLSFLVLIYTRKLKSALYYNQQPNEVISQPDLLSALWDVFSQQKDEKATWLKLTWDFEATVPL